MRERMASSFTWMERDSSLRRPTQVFHRKNMHRSSIRFTRGTLSARDQYLPASCTYQRRRPLRAELTKGRHPPFDAEEGVAGIVTHDQRISQPAACQGPGEGIC